MRIKGAALALLSIILLVAGCQKDYESPKETRRSVKATVLEVRAFEVPVYRAFPGEVCAKHEIFLASKVSGYARQVLVDEGDVVEPGTLLVRIDDRDLREEIKALEADLASIAKERKAIEARLRYAKANFERFKRLFAEQAATKEELDRAQATYESLTAQEEAFRAKETAARARLAKVRALLPYTVIKSPTRAVVVKRLISQGSLVTPGAPLLVLDDLSAGFRFCAAVDEGLLGRVKRGQVLRVEFPTLGLSLKTPASEIVEKIDPSSRTFVVKLDLTQRHWSSGVFGRLYLPVKKEKKVLIPWQAVISRGEITGVFVLDEKGLVRFQVIRTGATYRQEGEGFVLVSSEERTESRGRGSFVEVLSGLSPGERIVLEADRVHDGDQIQE